MILSVPVLSVEAFLRIRSAIRTLIEAKNRVVDEVVTVMRGQIPEWLRPRRFFDQVWIAHKAIA